jgi:hypothetical protein
MDSPGAKSFRGWVRYTRGFLRAYGLALGALLLLLLAANLLWPEADLRGRVKTILQPILSAP